MVIIENKKDCCGCSACQQICPKECISMATDEEGFLYPNANKDACISCGLCQKVCPMLHKNMAVNVISSFAYKHEDEKVRMDSSSGGAFSFYAEKVLRMNGVIYGAGFTDNWKVMHKRIDSLDKLDQIRRSKYVQSNINNTYLAVKKDLNSGLKVLFTGTPCQIAGLKTFLRKDYPNLFLIDVFCHGVPSPEVFNMYLTEIGNHPQTTLSSSPIGFLIHERKRKLLQDVNFRDKENSRWRLFSLKLNFKEYNGQDNIIVNNWKNDVFNQGFLNHLYLRPSCHDCKFRNQTSGSDITIGDFWGIEKIIPKEMFDDCGYNAVIINTPKGMLLSDDMEKLKDVSFEDIVKNNGSLIESPHPNVLRETFFKKYKKKGMLFMTKVCVQQDLFSKVYRKLLKYKMV